MSDVPSLLSVTEQDGVLLVRFARAQISDIEVADVLDVEFRKLVQDKANRSWIIDFAGVDIIISRVVSILLVVLRSLRAKGGVVCLCNLNETVERVVKLARLDRVFNIYPTLEQGLASVRQ